MRIGIVGTRGIPARYGGFETNVEVTATALVERGHNVTVYCRGHRGGRPLEYRGVKLVYLPVWDRKHIATLEHTALSIFHSIFTSFDIIHIYNVGNAPLLPTLKLFGRRAVISVDGIEWRRPKYGGFACRYMHSAEHFAVRYADAVIVDSKSVGKYYKSQYGIDPVYIPYGADWRTNHSETGVLRELGLKPMRYILFVGRLMPEKGMHYLIDAFSRLDASDFKLVIVGDNPYDRRYVESLRAKQSDRVLFPGVIYDERINDLFENAYLYVSPSEVEGTSPALLSAMGAGVCVLVNGIAEQLETIGNAGLSYRLNDIDDLTAKMRKLIDNRDMRDSYASLARKWVETHYCWDEIVDSYEYLLSKIANR